MDTNSIPPYKPRPQLPTDYVALGIVLNEGRILVCRRPKDAFLGGLWEFPGGKREPLEPYARCAEREVLEETALTVRAVREMPPVRHDYETRRVVLQPYVCQAVSGEPRPVECDEVRWVTAAELEELEMPAANGPVIAGILALLSAA